MDKIVELCVSFLNLIGDKIFYFPRNISWITIIESLLGNAEVKHEGLARMSLICDISIADRR